MKTSGLDYSAFSKTTPIKESVSESVRSMNNAFRRATGAGKFLYASAFVSVAAAVGFSTVLFLISLFDDTAPLFATIVFAIMALTSFGLIGYGLVGYGKRAVVVRKFSEDNGFEFEKNIVLSSDSGALFGLNLARYTRNAVKQVGKERQFMLFDYRYQTGSARHPSVNLYNVLMLNLKNATPNIVAIHKKSNHSYITWGRLGKKFKSNNILDDTFKFYGSESGLEGLYKILEQPSVKQLLENTKACDFEVYNQRLYVFMKGMYKNPKTIKVLMEVANMLTSE